MVALQFGLLFILFLQPNAKIIFESIYLNDVTTTLNIFAALLLLFAFIALRPSLRVSPIPMSGAPLITSGIYRWIRHPMYVSVVIFGFGMALNNLNWLTIIIWLALVATLIVKARFEDSLLRAIHESAYQYQNKRKVKGK